MALSAVLLLALLPPVADPGADVLRVFGARCAVCHDSAAYEPEGDFDFVLDLKKLAADPSKVVPGDPDHSNLWKLVNAGNMPPGGKAGGPLDDSQKQAVRAWILAGCPQALPPAPPAPAAPAPAAADAPAPAPAPPVPPPPPPAPPQKTLGEHLLRWFGELHLLLLHFPIVCIVAAALAEGWRGFRGGSGSPPTATFCLVVAGLASIPTVVCGWTYAYTGHGAARPDTLFWHRWLGTAGGCLLVVTALFSLWVERRPGLQPRTTDRVRRALLALCAVLVVAAAHFGGKLAFGQNFLSW